MKFSTKDAQHNPCSRNCAEEYKGAWWYNCCHNSNLNGLYRRGHHTSYGDGVNWKLWKGFNYSLKKTEMKIRPRQFWHIFPNERLKMVKGSYILEGKCKGFVHFWGRMSCRYFCNFSFNLFNCATTKLTLWILIV